MTESDTIQPSSNHISEHNPRTLATISGGRPCLRAFQVTSSGTAPFDIDDETQCRIYHHHPVLPRRYPSFDKPVYFCMPVARLDYFGLHPSPPLAHQTPECLHVQRFTA